MSRVSDEILSRLEELCKRLDSGEEIKVTKVRVEETVDGPMSTYEEGVLGEE